MGKERRAELRRLHICTLYYHCTSMSSTPLRLYNFIIHLTNLCHLRLYSFVARGWWARNAEQMIFHYWHGTTFSPAVVGAAALLGTPRQPTLQIGGLTPAEQSCDCYDGSLTWEKIVSHVPFQKMKNHATAATHLYHQRLYIIYASTPDSDGVGGESGAASSVATTSNGFSVGERGSVGPRCVCSVSIFGRDGGRPAWEGVVSCFYVVSVVIRRKGAWGVGGIVVHWVVPPFGWCCM